MKLEALLRVCEARRAGGEVVVFTNGCFDLLHIGHLRYLEVAKECGDFLVVGINSDASVRRIKGYPRPIVNENERSELVAGLHCVDGVVLFETPDPMPLIEKLKPDVLVKGADWAPDKIVGASLVTSYGGRVVRVPLVELQSTSALIKRIVSAHEKERMGDADIP